MDEKTKVEDLVIDAVSEEISRKNEDKRGLISGIASVLKFLLGIFLKRK